MNKRNDIMNRQIIRRAMINNDSDYNIFISIDKFSDYGSRQVTGYYGQNNYINQSNFVSMVSSELNNEEDKNMDVSHKLPLPNKKVYKSLPYNSKPVSNIKGTDKILQKSELTDEMLYKSKGTDKILYKFFKNNKDFLILLYIMLKLFMDKIKMHKDFACD